MRLLRPVALVCGLSALIFGCSSLTRVINPFLGYTDEYGVAGQQQQFEGGAASGISTEDEFRRTMTLSFFNNHSGAILDTSYVAWVDVSSVRSAEQQDALLRGGYSQLTSEVRLGTAFTLPVGTFVYEGPGLAGATQVKLAAAQGADDQGENQGDGEPTAVTPTSTSFDLLTPDAILVFSQPPTSCDSVAFTFSDPVSGEILGGFSTAGGGYKTLAQVDVYQCSPLRPGVFFSSVGGAKQPNEFREGEAVTFSFFPTATNGAYATVTIGSAQTAATTGGGDGG